MRTSAVALAVAAVAVVAFAMVGLAGVPMVRVIRERSRRAAVNDLLVRLTSPASVERVQSALQEILDDPSVVVLYWWPGPQVNERRDDRLSHSGDEGGDYVGADGAVVAASATPGRMVLAGPMDESGRPLGLVQLAARESRAQRLRAEAAVTACGPALLNARLQILTRARARELRESRARVVAAAVEERRRLERDLHDGAQTPLLAVSTRLSALRTRLNDADSLAALDAARHELRGALSGLRAMTRDLFPSVLDSDGLAAALEEAGDEGGVRLNLDVVEVVGKRFAADVESIAYLTVADVLAGLRRTLGVSEATVRVARREDLLLLGVEYSIIAGVTTAPGTAADLSWLTVATDRLRAVGGDLSTGTGSLSAGWVEARVPCE